MIQGNDNEFAKVFKRKKMIRIARFRLGSEMREGTYWEREEKRRVGCADGWKNLGNM